MGLDTYALRRYPPEGIYGKLTDEDKAAFAAANINLCGGMLSGNGDDGSFRGKVYDDLVQEVTGQTLYQELIDPETVKEMAQALAEVDPAIAGMYRMGKREVTSLQRFFQVAAERGLALYGWW